MVFNPVRVQDYPMLTQIARDELIMEYAASFYCASGAAGWDYGLAFVDGGFVIKETLPDGVGYVIAGKPDLKAVLRELYEPQKRLRLRYVDERRLGDFEGQGFEFAVSHNEIYSDYIVKRDDFVNLKGDKNKHKRYKYNKFMHNYEYEIADIPGAQVEACMRVMSKWCDQRDCATCSYDCEQDILEHMLLNAKALNLTGKLVYVDGEPAALSVMETKGDVAYSFHAKADDKYEGLAVFVRVEHAKSVQAATLNCGYDAGVPGVRAFKNMFKPYALLHKYELNAK